MDPRASAFRVRADVERNEVPDGYVIYDERNGKVIFLNPTAAAVLEMCDGTFTQVEIEQAIQEAFDLAEPPSQEVAECLQNLLEEELIEPCCQS